MGPSRLLLSPTGFQVGRIGLIAETNWNRQKRNKNTKSILPEKGCLSIRVGHRTNVIES